MHAALEENAHMREFIGNGLHGTRDIFVESGMSRLKNRGFILLASNKYFCWVNLSDIKDGVYRNLNLDFVGRACKLKSRNN